MEEFTGVAATRYTVFDAGQVQPGSVTPNIGANMQDVSCTSLYIDF